MAAFTILVPPSITTQPKGRSVPVGLPTIFNAAASGSPPLVYQWQLNGTNIPGANSNNCTNAAVTFGDFGAYQLVVTNGAAPRSILAGIRRRGVQVLVAGKRAR